MIDRRMWRGLAAAAAVVLAPLLVPVSGFAFPQSTETSGEITPDLTGTWFIVNRLEFPKDKNTPAAAPAASPAPAKSPEAGAIRHFTVGYLFKIKHLPTEEAQKMREADKAAKQAAVEKATKILAEEQEKAAKDPKPAASGELPVEPKVLSYGIPKAPDSVADMHDEVSIELLDVDLPKSVQDSIDKANKEEAPWEPTEKDLAALKASLKSLKPRAKTEYARIQWKVIENKYLEGGMLTDEKTKNAKFVISGDAALIASPGQANRSILIYGAEKVEDRVLEGGHTRAIMTAAPFPIPIDMKGTFKAFRLTDLPKPPAKKGE